MGSIYYDVYLRDHDDVRVDADQVNIIKTPPEDGSTLYGETWVVFVTGLIEVARFDAVTVIGYQKRGLS